LLKSLTIGSAQPGVLQCFWTQAFVSVGFMHKKQFLERSRHSVAALQNDVCSPWWISCISHS
jgi:hypothetical protein